MFFHPQLHCEFQPFFPFQIVHENLLVKILPTPDKEQIKNRKRLVLSHRQFRNTHINSAPEQAFLQTEDISAIPVEI